MEEKSVKFDAVVIGVSAGGIGALEKILPFFSRENSVTIFIVQHLAAGSGGYLVEHFKRRCKLPVIEPHDKEPVTTGCIYFAPANYHMMVEQQKTIALSTLAKVNYSRPAVDVLFSTAAEVYGKRLIGLILTGANSDGASGLARIKQLGGLTVVQSPDSAEVDIMPKAAITASVVDHILPLTELGPFLVSLISDERE